MLVLSIRKNQKVVVTVNGVRIVVTFIRFESGQSKLGFDAPPEVKILREELEKAA